MDPKWDPKYTMKCWVCVEDQPHWELLDVQCWYHKLFVMVAEMEAGRKDAKELRVEFEKARSLRMCPAHLPEAAKVLMGLLNIEHIEQEPNQEAIEKTFALTQRIDKKMMQRSLVVVNSVQFISSCWEKIQKETEIESNDTSEATTSSPVRQTDSPPPRRRADNLSGEQVHYQDEDGDEEMEDEEKEGEEVKDEKDEKEQSDADENVKADETKEEEKKDDAITVEEQDKEDVIEVKEESSSDTSSVERPIPLQIQRIIKLEPMSPEPESLPARASQPRIAPEPESLPARASQPRIAPEPERTATHQTASVEPSRKKTRFDDEVILVEPAALSNLERRYMRVCTICKKRVITMEICAITSKLLTLFAAGKNRIMTMKDARNEFRKLKKEHDVRLAIGKRDESLIACEKHTKEAAHTIVELLKIGTPKNFKKTKKEDMDAFLGELREFMGDTPIPLETAFAKRCQATIDRFWKVDGQPRRRARSATRSPTRDGKKPVGRPRSHSVHRRGTKRERPAVEVEEIPKKKQRGRPRLSETPRRSVEKSKSPEPVTGRVLRSRTSCDSKSRRSTTTSTSTTTKSTRSTTPRRRIDSVNARYKSRSPDRSRMAKERRSHTPHRSRSSRRSKTSRHSETPSPRRPTTSSRNRSHSRSSCSPRKFNVKLSAARSSQTSNRNGIQLREPPIRNADPKILKSSLKPSSTSQPHRQLSPERGQSVKTPRSRSRNRSNAPSPRRNNSLELIPNASFDSFNIELSNNRTPHRAGSLHPPKSSQSSEHSSSLNRQVSLSSDKKKERSSVHGIPGSSSQGPSTSQSSQPSRPPPEDYVPEVPRHPKMVGLTMVKHQSFNIRPMAPLPTPAPTPSPSSMLSSSSSPALSRHWRTCHFCGQKNDSVKSKQIEEEKRVLLAVFIHTGRMEPEKAKLLYEHQQRFYICTYHCTETAVALLNHFDVDVPEKIEDDEQRQVGRLLRHVGKFEKKQVDVKDFLAACQEFAVNYCPQ